MDGEKKFKWDWWKVIPLLPTLFTGSLATFLFQFLFITPSPSLTASAVAHDFETPSIEHNAESKPGAFSKFLKISVKNQGQMPADQVRIIFEEGEAIYATKGDSEAKKASDSIIPIGNIEVGKHVLVRVWGDQRLSERGITVAHGKGAFEIDALRRHEPDWRYSFTIWACLVTVVGYWGLSVAELRVRKRERTEAENRIRQLEEQQAEFSRQGNDLIAQI
jgi:hypothetical protein